LLIRGGKRKKSSSSKKRRSPSRSTTNWGEKPYPRERGNLRQAKDGEGGEGTFQKTRRVAWSSTQEKPNVGMQNPTRMKGVNWKRGKGRAQPDEGAHRRGVEKTWKKSRGKRKQPREKWTSHSFRRGKLPLSMASRAFPFWEGK